MKTYKYYFLSFLLLTLFISVSCEDSNETLKTYNDNTLISFQNSSFSLSIPEEDLTLQIPVFSSTLSSMTRTFSAAITSATDNTSGEYTLGTITIPANEYEGIFTVDFDFSEISGNDGDIKQLVISIVTPDGVLSYNDVVTIDYFREIVCNDLNLTIVSDVWATETYFTIETVDGTVLVNRFFPFSANSATPQTYNVQFTLPNGEYVFKLGDAYGDGQVGTGGGVTLTGSYNLSCSIITHASGSGAFSGAVADPFPGAAGAEVEVTAFTINP